VDPLAPVQVVDGQTPLLVVVEPTSDEPLAFSDELAAFAIAVNTSLTVNGATVTAEL
jgi:hypothetical protein